MGWHFTDDPETYAAACLPLLSADPVRNTVALTVLDAIRHGQRWGDGAFTLGWFTEPGGAVTGAVSMTPPFGILLTVVPAHALPTLLDGLRGLDIPSVNGQPETVDAFVAGWGGDTELVHEQRLFRLDELIPPDPPPAGSARLVGVADLDLVMDWIGAFHAESEPTAPATPRDMMAYRIERELYWFWSDEDGTPVSMAGRNVTTAGVSRIGPVYTPMAQRRHGYAAGATAVCSQHALDTDAERVILFTDLANPTSNGVYRRLGFRPIEDRVVRRFC